MGNVKKVAAIHDLSGVGRCSLSVILPTLSAMGIQVCSVPTAVLSTHTGGFGDIVLRDLTEYISPALEHYKRLDINFDCIYSGFLASVGQIEHCREFFINYKNSLKVVDPVLGDYGKPYSTCTSELCEGMNKLVEIADIITPNPTEADILLKEHTIGQLYTAQQLKSRLVRLAEKGPDIVVIKGVDMVDGKKYNVGFSKNDSKFWKVGYDYVPANYPGTGDIFASVLTGGLLKGDSLPIAINRATNFLEIAIKMTYSYSSDTREGVMLESCLNYLITDKILYDYEQL